MNTIHLSDIQLLREYLTNLIMFTRSEGSKYRKPERLQEEIEKTSAFLQSVDTQINLSNYLIA